MLTDDGIDALASSKSPNTRDNVVVAGSLLHTDGCGEAGNAVYGMTSLGRDIAFSWSDSAWRTWFGWWPYGPSARQRCGAIGLSGAERTWCATCSWYGKHTTARAGCCSITSRGGSLVVVGVTGRGPGRERVSHAPWRQLRSYAI